MNLPFFIARRYVFSKKTHNVINIISGISTFGIAVSTTAMVLVLSGFNGIEHVIEEMYSAFDADIRITPKEGKTVSESDLQLEKLEKMAEVEYISPFIEETTILKNDNDEAWVIARMKGVEAQFLEMTNMDEFIREGETMIESQGLPFALMGSGLMHNLQAYIHGDHEIVPYERVKVMGLVGKKKLSRAREDAMRDTVIDVAGRFSINPKYDTDFYIVPIEFARELLLLDDQLSGVELGLADDADAAEVSQILENWYGDRFTIEDKEDQNALLFKTHRSEKWITFLILCFIFVLSTFNMIASLTMLIMDKRKDISTLKAMGANQTTIRKIFISEGLLINFIGVIVGLILGLLITIGQMKFGWVGMGENAVVTAFPMRIVWFDLIWIFVMVTIVGVLSTYLPVRYLLRNK